MDLDELPCLINPFQHPCHPHNELFPRVALPPEPPDLPRIKPRHLVTFLRVKAKKGDAELLGAGDVVFVIRRNLRAAYENLTGIRADFHVMRNGMHQRDEGFSISGDERVKVGCHRIMRGCMLHREFR